MWRNVTLLSLCQGLMMTANALMVAAAALVGYELADNKALATLPLALAFLSTMLSAIPASFIMQRIGRRLGFMLAATIGIGGAVLAVASIQADNFLGFAIASMLFGVHNGFGNYYRFAAADVASVAYRSRAIALVTAGGVLAAFAGPNLARLTKDILEGAAFAGSFIGVTLLYVLILTASFFMTIPKPAPELYESPARPLRALLRQPAFSVAVIAGMLGYAVMTLVMTATPLAMRHHQHGFDEAAFVIQWHVFAMFAPAFVTGHVIRALGVLPVILIGAVCEAGCVVAHLLGETVTHFWLGLILLGLGWNFCFVGATQLLTENYRPPEKAKAQALNDFLVFTSVTLAALGSGVLLQQAGWRAVNLGVIPLLAVVIIAVLTLMVARRRVPYAAE